MKKILSLLPALFFFLFPQLALAQSISLSLSPPVTELLLRPNTPVKQTFILKTNATNVTVIPELHLVTPSDDFGHVTINPGSLNPADLPLVITSDHPLNTPINTNGDLILTLTITAANTDTPLDSYLALVFRTQPTSASQNLDVGGAISALLLTSINPSGTFPINLDLSNFDPSVLHDSTQNLNLAPIVQNNTPSMFRPQGIFEVISPSGKVLSTTPLYPHLILGRSSRQHYLSWTPHFSNIGPHRLKLTITTEGGTTILESEKIVWLFPWRISLLILLVIAIFSLTLARIRSRFKVV